MTKGCHKIKCSVLVVSSFLNTRVNNYNYIVFTSCVIYLSSNSFLSKNVNRYILLQAECKMSKVSVSDIK